MLEALIPVVGKIIEDILPDNSPETAQKKIELQEQILKAYSDMYSKQADINLAESNSNTFFRYGWRDTLAWGCTVAFCWSFMFKPIIDYVLMRYGMPALPAFDSGQLSTLLMSLLGLGAMHSYDKAKENE